MRQLTLVLLLILLLTPTANAEHGPFAEFQEIYLKAFERIISDDHGADRDFSVSMTIQPNRPLVPMPEHLWTQLAIQLTKKSVDLSRYVPANEVVWVKQDANFVRKVTGEAVWVYTIDGIQWRGSNRLYVLVEMTHGVLAGAGSTLIMARRNGKWKVLAEMDEWIATIHHGVGTPRNTMARDIADDENLHVFPGNNGPQGIAGPSQNEGVSEQRRDGERGSRATVLLGRRSHF
jgi:hypothetical protein